MYSLSTDDLIAALLRSVRQGALVLLLACGAGIACLTDKAEEHRLRKMPAWLEHILAQLLAPLSGTAPSAALDLRLVDGSVICTPGRGGTD